mmetsp:Transcript_18139/g.51645  ORF Transcript_18139/g.51645 Transcript_18139/m.51645 type:complete len:556 (+) Transcript_18139:249-1916(+)
MKRALHDAIATTTNSNAAATAMPTATARTTTFVDFASILASNDSSATKNDALSPPNGSLTSVSQNNCSTICMPFNHCSFPSSSPNELGGQTQPPSTFNFSQMPLKANRFELLQQQQQQSWLEHPKKKTRQSPALESPSMVLSEGEMLLAKEMDQLSLKERETVYDDIHGVSSVIDETEQLIAQSLNAFAKELHDFRSPNKSAYEYANFLSPSFAQDRALRLAFLRSSQFDVAKATKRFVQHFYEKLQLFGSDRLVSHIGWNDLHEEDRVGLRKGGVHMPMNSRDSSGRNIYVEFFPKWEFTSVDSHRRAEFYNFMSCIRRDEQSQRRGIVVIGYTIGSTLSGFANAMVLISRSQFEDFLPFRVMGVHLCIDTSSISTFRPFLSLLLKVIPKSIRLRSRIHMGSHLECQYAMNSFGIPISVLPFDASGNVYYDRLYQQIQWMQAMEQQEMQQQGQRIMQPLEQDCLFGRGAPSQHFVGNIRLIELVDSFKAEHDNATSRKEKTVISMKVVQQVKERHKGRFLKRCEDGVGWYEVTDTTARDKVSMAFRNLKRKDKD